MFFGIDDFTNQFLAWSIGSAAVMTGLSAVVLIVRERWVEFRNSRGLQPQPVSIPLGHPRGSERRSNPTSF